MNGKRKRSLTPLSRSSSLSSTSTFTTPPSSPSPSSLSSQTSSSSSSSSFSSGESDAEDTDSLFYTSSSASSTTSSSSSSFSFTSDEEVEEERVEPSPPRRKRKMSESKVSVNTETLSFKFNEPVNLGRGRVLHWFPRTYSAKREFDVADWNCLKRYYGHDRTASDEEKHLVNLSMVCLRRQYDKQQMKTMILKFHPDKTQCVQDKRVAEILFNKLYRAYKGT
jgi:hypothetical protein